MVEEISVTSVVLFGASAWLADKLFGPSAEALGDQLKLFAGERLSKVFRRVEILGIPKEATALPPGFAYTVVQKISLSEDNEKLTEMWAHLIRNASSGYRSNHVLYAEILSQIGPDEATILDELAPNDLDIAIPVIVPVSVVSSIRQAVENATMLGAISGAQATVEINKLLNLQLPWPGQVTSVTMPYRGPNDTDCQWADGGVEVSVAHEVLIRQQLIEKLAFDLRLSMPAASVEAVMVTGLGLDFLNSCRGRE